MTERQWQIGIVGTFDVQNYGDMLFPIIAERELSSRLGRVKVYPFSYHAKSPPEWPYRVWPVADLPDMAPRLDAILIGGGFLIRFDKEVAPGYGPPNGRVHHPTGYWLTPALIALQHGIPLIWNAPGMHCNDIPGWAEPLMELALEASDYIAVRDAPSKEAILRFTRETPIAVVPDTAFRLAKLFEAGPSRALEELRVAAGLSDRYIVIQAALGLDPILTFIKSNAVRFAGYQFVALPIGPVLTDDPTILASQGLPRLVTLPFWPDPILLAELISHAEAVVGHSYHLAITALAYGVPAFTAMPLSVGKYAALQRYDTMHQLERDAAPDVDWFFDRVGKREPSAAVEQACHDVMEHWDKVVAAIVVGPAPRPSFGEFLQRLPTLLENPQIQLQTATAALTDQAEAQRRIGELQIFLDLARAEIQTSEDAAAADQIRADDLEVSLRAARDELRARDRNIQTLYDSKSWKVTRPLRVLFRSMKRLTGM